LERDHARAIAPDDCLWQCRDPDSRWNRDIGTTSLYPDQIF